MQSRTRALPDLGFTPWLASQRQRLEISHWSGPRPTLEAHQTWVYSDS